MNNSDPKLPFWASVNTYTSSVIGYSLFAVAVGLLPVAFQVKFANNLIQDPDISLTYVLSMGALYALAIPLMANAMLTVSQCPRVKTFQILGLGVALVFLIWACLQCAFLTSEWTSAGLIGAKIEDELNLINESTNAVKTYSCAVVIGLYCEILGVAER
jgi:hypothetical protein